MQKLNAGRLLEARIHRLVLSQGVFAERGLIPSASSDHRLLATDIDILATEYHFNFHASKHHYECKSGKISPLDRIFWMRGVRELLQADGSTIVLSAYDPDAIAFAKRLGIELMKLSDIERLEHEMKIASSWWPGRSGPRTLDSLRCTWKDQWSPKEASKIWLHAKECFAFLEIDGWEKCDYRTLNKLFRLIDEIVAYSKTESDETLQKCYGYLTGSLCVRLSQIIQVICSDMIGREPSDRRMYLGQRLTFGDNNPEYSLKLINGTAAIIQSSNQKPDQSQKLVFDTSRLTSMPKYGEDLIKLVEEFLASPLEARYVPIAFEMRVFGEEGISSSLTQLTYAINQGRRLVDYCLGFLIRNFAVSSSTLAAIPKLLNDDTVVEQV